MFSSAEPRPLRVNNGLYRQPCHTSAYPPEADVNDAKAEVAVGMSAVGGRADVVCQELSGPLIAKMRHSDGRNGSRWVAYSQNRTLRRLVVVVLRTEAKIAWREALVADTQMTESGPSC